MSFGFILFDFFNINKTNMDYAKRIFIIWRLWFRCERDLNNTHEIKKVRLTNSNHTTTTSKKIITLVLWQKSAWDREFLQNCVDFSIDKGKFKNSKFF